MQLHVSGVHLLHIDLTHTYRTALAQLHLSFWSQWKPTPESCYLLWTFYVWCVCHVVLLYIIFQNMMVLVIITIPIHSYIDIYIFETIEVTSLSSHHRIAAILASGSWNPSPQRNPRPMTRNRNTKSKIYHTSQWKWVDVVKKNLFFSTLP